MRRRVPGAAFALFAGIAACLAGAALVGACSSFSGSGGAADAGDASAETATEAGPDATASDGGEGACTACAPGAACFEGVCDGAHPISVSAGTTSACVALRSGSVWCWGDDRKAQLGVPPESLSRCGLEACRPSAARVAGIDGAVEVAVGGYFACARRSDGSVWCWGANGARELGRTSASTCGGTPCDPKPARVEGLPPVTQLSLGVDVGCARTTDARVFCWGEGRLGNLGPIGDSGVAPAGPVEIAGLSDIAEVQLALHGEGRQGAGACARTSSGTVLCWGLHNGGELGHVVGEAGDELCRGDDQFYACNPTPSLVASPTGKAVTGVGLSVGVQGACALRAPPASAQCWGSNPEGQIAQPSPFDGTCFPPSPVAAVGPRIAGRFSNHCVINTTGSLVCWGMRLFGAVPAVGEGNAVGFDAGPVTCGTVPCQPTPSPIGVDNVEAVASGRAFFVAVKNDGSVVAWGANPDGRLGHEPGKSGDLSTGGAAAVLANAVVQRVSGLP
jgi:alpha-tubulin suppressor-like RCC1 family protein